ncbi:MAG: signal peptidase II [Pyrinomonadaceae bacterium]
MSDSTVKSGRAADSTEAQRAMRWRAIYLMAAFGIFTADQMTKAWAIARLRFSEEIVVIPGFLNFTYAENTGIAFGQLQYGGAMRWLLVLFAAIAAVGVLIYFFRAPRDGDRVLGACALLIAGILGNLADRVRLGYVVDFILFYVKDFHWPIFNIADMSICAGALLLAIDAFSDRGQRSEVGGQ